MGSHASSCQRDPRNATGGRVTRNAATVWLSVLAPARASPEKPMNMERPCAPGSHSARIVGALLSVLRARDGALGTVSICNGGGGASAMVIERL